MATSPEEPMEPNTEKLLDGIDEAMLRELLRC